MLNCISVEQDLIKASEKVEIFQELSTTNINEAKEILEKALLQENFDSDDNWEDEVNKVVSLLNKVSNQHKDLHPFISKIGKSIDKNFYSNYDDAVIRKSMDFLEKHFFHQELCQHFFRTGLKNVANTLIKEDSELERKDESESFIELYNIIEALRNKELSLAMTFVKSHRSKLEELKSNLEFYLHRLAFLKIIENGSNFVDAAFAYARLHLAHFVNTNQKEFSQLMGCLAFANNLSSSPYAQLFDDNSWDLIIELFVKDFCMINGFSRESPLMVVLNCGIKAYPPLFNIKQMMQEKSVSWNFLNGDELPTEVELDEKYRYHSIFACPILRQESTPSNPPMRLGCGHVISKNALNKLSNTAKTKCPYCPEEIIVGEAQEVFF